jgi:hypothetical protein
MPEQRTLPTQPSPTGGADRGRHGGALLLAGLLAVSALVAAALPPAAVAQTLDEILANHYKARGGLEKIKALQSVRMTGKMILPMGMEAPVTMEMKRPMMMRMDFSLQGLTGTQAYDGKAGWQVMPFGGKSDPEPMSADDLKEYEEQADMDGLLVDWKSKGHTVELVGKETVEGADAYKLKITMKSGDVRYSYIESESWLEIRNEGKRKHMGGEVETEATFGDFKPVEGLVFPFSVEVGAHVGDQKQKIVIEKVELNPAIDAARFKMPAAAPAAEEKKAGAPAEKAAEKPAEKKAEKSPEKKG